MLEKSFMKKILILGASSNQLPLILKSKELGYIVIVCDRTDTNPGLKYVDKHYKVNFMEQETVLEIARKENVDGVISNSEPAMPVVAYISETLGLEGNSVESVSYFMQKKAFRDLQQKLGLYSPKHFNAKSVEDFYQGINDLSFPIIIKPCESSGSRGTTKIESLSDKNRIENAINECLDFSRNHTVTIEEYVSMKEPEVLEGEIFVYKGEILWDGLFYNRRSYEHPMVPMTDCGPVKIDEKVNQAKTVLEKIIKASGLQFGQLNPELYFTSTGQVFVIEVNPRQGGGDNSGFIKQFSGVDLHKLLVTTTVGDDSYYKELKSYERKYSHIVSHQVFSKKDGIYEGMYVSGEVEKYIIHRKEKVAIGSFVNSCSNATDVIGQFFMKFDSDKEQYYYFRNIEQYIYPIIK